MALTEFDLIYRYLAAYGTGTHVTLGVGDDAAILAPPAGNELLVSTDSQLCGRHFPEYSLPEDIAKRVVAAAASDLAAMGAEPLAMTLALSLPETDELWLHGFSMGLANVVKALGLPLVGGDLTRGPLALTVTVMGYAPVGSSVQRRGAQPGDQLCVTGTLGDAAAALALMSGEEACLLELGDPEQQYLERRFYDPTPRFELATWLREHATAAIDISDGLLADLEHVASASGVALELSREALPLSPVLQQLPRKLAESWALSGGDDYELAFTVPAGIPLPLGVSCVGYASEGEGVNCEGAPALRGYDHFGVNHD